MSENLRFALNTLAQFEDPRGERTANDVPAVLQATVLPAIRLALDMVESRSDCDDFTPTVELLLNDAATVVDACVEALRDGAVTIGDAGLTSHQHAAVVEDAATVASEDTTGLSYSRKILPSLACALRIKLESAGDES